MTLKVIGVGPGRTGTVSMMIALHMLGYGPCHHMQTCIGSRLQSKWFLEAAQGKPMDWKDVFDGFDAAVDWPAAAYYRELIDAFPEAKVIFTYRDPDTWYDSVASTIYQVVPSTPSWVRLIWPRVRLWTEMVNLTIWQNEFEARFEDRAYASAFMTRRLAAVKALVPEDRLLVHTATDGWGPLCEFLGKDIPEEPYPRANEAARIQGAVKGLRALRFVPAVVVGLALFAAALALSK